MKIDLKGNHFANIRTCSVRLTPNPQKTAGLVIFTEKILNGKLHFMYIVSISNRGAIQSNTFVMLIIFVPAFVNCYWMFC